MSSGYLSEKDKSKKETRFIKKPSCSLQLGFLFWGNLLLEFQPK